MLDRVQERSWRRILGIPAGFRLRGAQKVLAQWAIVDDYNAILDLACHDAGLLRFLSRKFSLRACGIADCSEDARSLREHLPEAEIFCARREDIPWKDECFDVVLYHMKKKEGGGSAFLREAMRVLKPNGQMLIALQGLPEPLCAAAELAGIADLDGRVKPRELLQDMESAGFSDVSYRVSRPNVGLAMGWKREV